MATKKQQCVSCGAVVQMPNAVDRCKHCWRKHNQMTPHEVQR